jgi:hypothetical protein
MVKMNLNRQCQLSIVIVGLCVAFAAVTKSNAAEIQMRQTVSESGFKSNSAYFEGQIVQGDAKKVAKFFVLNPALKLIYLNSPGGDVQEGITIGEIVKTLRVNTEVDSGAKCASSCFFIWMNGSWRRADGPDSKYGTAGWVGLHRPYLTNQSNTDGSLEAQNASVRSVSTYLESKLIPRRFIDYMTERPSNDIYWLTNKDIQDLGDSPPDIEELYIAKCGGSVRMMKTEFAAAMKAQDGSGAGLRQKLDSLLYCAMALDDKARADAVVKLRSGWMPKVQLGYKK